MNPIDMKFWEWFVKTGSIQGLGFMAIAGFLALVFYGTFRAMRAIVALIQDIREKWLPQLVSGHMTFLETTKLATMKTADAVGRLTESTGISHDNHRKTHRAVECIVMALKEDCCDEARKHLDNAIQELK